MTAPPPAAMRRTVLALCTAQVLGMCGAFAFPALLPDFQRDWGLSNTEAGWISGIYFAGYATAVPVLTALTDRIDARRVWLGGMLVTALSAAGFALAAQGFTSAMLFRALGGAGLAGTYMPGLKALVDRTQGPSQPRWMSWYTASFSLGTSVSFLAAGAAAELWGWRAAYGLSAASALAALLLVAAIVGPVRLAHPPPAGPLLDFRPVVGNRRVFGYILAYAAHAWELFCLRSWMVAFLAAAAALHSAQPLVGPTTVATLGALLAMAASIGGAELAVRFDRRRYCALAAASSAGMAAVLGFCLTLPYGLLAGLVIVYNGLAQLDSAALTTGAMLEADPKRRGSTIALHSLLGFATGFVGPLAFGGVLDLAKGNPHAWAFAFLSLAAAAATAPLAVMWGGKGR